MNDTTQPVDAGQAGDSSPGLDLDDDTPVAACPMRKPGDDEPCESCQ